MLAAVLAAVLADVLAAGWLLAAAAGCWLLRRFCLFLVVVMNACSPSDKHKSRDTALHVRPRCVWESSVANVEPTVRWYKCWLGACVRAVRAVRAWRKQPGCRCRCMTWAGLHIDLACGGECRRRFYLFGWNQTNLQLLVLQITFNWAIWQTFLNLCEPRELCFVH